ncbi:MAG: hypothetical protein AB1730_25165 [Myxococcota bacterium]|jgi:hypothetical protein
MHALLVAGMVALSVGAKAPSPGDAIAGDYVDYEVSSAAKPRLQVVVRLQAVVVTKKAVVVDVRAMKGRAPPWLAEPGLRLTLALDGKAPRREVPGNQRAGRESRPVKVERAGQMFSCTNYAFESKRGPSGAGCIDAAVKALALTGGLVDETLMNAGPKGADGYALTLVGFGHEDVPTTAPPVAYGPDASWTVWEKGPKERLVRRAVTSAGGKLVVTTTVFTPKPGKAAKGEPTVDGRAWKAGPSTQRPDTLLQHLVALLKELPEGDSSGEPGAELSVGPKPMKTTREKAGGRTETRVARPSEVPEAPLPVRFGVIAAEGGDADFSLVEWK